MKRGGHATKANASGKLAAWRKSPRFKAMLREAGARGVTAAWAKPRCGAKTRSGEPCRGLAMANKRCRIHGGLTPSGDRWHKIRLPKKGEVDGLERFEAKRIEKEKRDAQSRQRLALMNPEQRAKHLAWQASHQPGPASGRAHRRQQLKTKAMLDGLLDAKEQLGRAIKSDAEVDVFG